MVFFQFTISIVVWCVLVLIHEFAKGDEINVGTPWIDDVNNATQWAHDSVYETNDGDFVHGLFSVQQANSRRFTFDNHNTLRLVEYLFYIV